MDAPPQAAVTFALPDGRETAPVKGLPGSRPAEQEDEPPPQYDFLEGSAEQADEHLLQSGGALSFYSDCGDRRILNRGMADFLFLVTSVPLHRLRSLDLRRVRLTKRRVHPLALSLTAHAPNLESLEAASTYLFPWGMREFSAGFLSDHPRLTHVGLRGNCIGGDGAAALAKAVCGSGGPPITTMDISLNEIPTSLELRTLLDKLRTLTSLDYRGNFLGDAGAGDVAGTLLAGGGAALRTLNLRGTAIGLDGVLTLLEVAKQCPHLEVLDCAFCGIDDEEGAPPPLVQVGDKLRMRKMGCTYDLVVTAVDDASDPSSGGCTVHEPNYALEFKAVLNAKKRRLFDVAEKMDWPVTLVGNVAERAEDRARPELAVFIGERFSETALSRTPMHGNFGGGQYVLSNAALEPGACVAARWRARSQWDMATVVGVSEGTADSALSTRYDLIYHDTVAENGVEETLIKREASLVVGG